MPQNQSLQGQLQEMPKIAAPDLNLEYNWSVSANAAMAYVAKNFYANMSNTLSLDVQVLENNYYTSLREKYRLSDAIIDRSKKWGQEVARIIFEWSKTDGAHECYTKNFPSTYKAPVGVGLWIPTFPKFQSALQPYWGINRSFITNIAIIYRPAAPITIRKIQVLHSTKKLF